MARFDRAAWAPKPPEFEGGGLSWTSSGVRSDKETYPWDSMKLVDQAIMAPGPTESGFTGQLSHNRRSLRSITPKEDIAGLANSGKKCKICAVKPA